MPTSQRSQTPGGNSPAHGKHGAVRSLSKQITISVGLCPRRRELLLDSYRPKKEAPPVELPGRFSSEVKRDTGERRLRPEVPFFVTAPMPPIRQAGFVKTMNPAASFLH